MEYLKCDADGCDHIELHPKLTADLVGRLCPKCGADLLTQKDYDDFCGVTRPIVELTRAIGLTAPTDDPNGGGLVKIGNHGGTFYITPPPQT